MRDAPLSPEKEKEAEAILRKLINGVVKGFVKGFAKGFVILQIVYLIGGVIASRAAHYAPFGSWGSLAVGLGVAVIYLFIVGLLEGAWARRSPN